MVKVRRFRPVWIRNPARPASAGCKIMADINLKCPSCGRECRVSEFAAEETLICPACARKLRRPATETSIKLKVRKAVAQTESALTGERVGMAATLPGISDEPDKQPTGLISQVHKVRGKVKRQRAIWGALLFFGLGGLMWAFQYYGMFDKQLYSLYVYARYALLGVALLLVLMAAFEDSYLQGILCLLLPFYIIYYVFSRMELLWIRGIFAAAVLMVGTEWYYYKDRSMIMVAQKQTNQFIDNVGRLIQRAGEAPDVPTGPPRKYRTKRK